MSEEASNNVEPVDLKEGENEKRPIMLLLKRLIRKKKNVTMTTAEIHEILKEEYNIDVKACHELELDTYANIIKRFLTNWKQWDDLDRKSDKLSGAKDSGALTKLLNKKYKSLKEYLGVMLEAAKPLMKKAVAGVDNRTVVMEIHCTKDQLHHLFYRRPHTDLNNTIFKVSNIEPTNVTQDALPLHTLLNFLWTKIYIQLPTFTFFRELNYEHEHTLVNKAIDANPTPKAMKALDTRLYNRGRKVKEYDSCKIFQYVDKIFQLCENEHNDIVQLLQVVFNIIKADLINAPEKINVPSNYKRNANKYKYVRFLYVENDEENTDPQIDLQLEELVTPSFQHFIGRMGKYPETLEPIKDWLRIECLTCQAKFVGSIELTSQLQAHYRECHQSEPDWQCSHCKKIFNVDFLSKNRWHHEC